MGFVLASIGSAVGLGSIWKFPYEVGENGGGAFLIFYVLGLLLVVVPLLLAEFVIGRRGRADVVACLRIAAREDGSSPRWTVAGAVAVAGGFLIMSYYAVIAGMTLDYTLRSIVRGFDGTDAAASHALYEAFVGDPLRLMAWQAAFLAAVAAIVARGVGSGIEVACSLLMPLLAVALIALAVYGAMEGDLGSAAYFLFAPKLDAFDARAALEALGLGFFSIGVGFGAMATYAAYSGRDVSLGKAAAVIVVGDTAVSVVAGFVIFPLVFAHGLDPAAGTGLVFVTLPIAFGRLPGGDVAAAAFFFLLFLAALGSSLSLVELIVAPLANRRGWGRLRATLAVGIALFAGGVPTVLSFNLWRDVRPLAGLPGTADLNVYGMVDGLASNVVLPLSGLLFAIFVGRRMPAGRVARALGWPERTAARLQAILRWPVPALIVGLVTAGIMLP